MRVDAALVGATAVVAALLLLLAYARIEKGYTGTYDCYRAVNGEALMVSNNLSNFAQYSSSRFRVTLYFSNGTTLTRGAILPRAQCYTYYLTSDSRGVLVLVKVEG
jgi:subtilase family serine protease|uniref:Uncharacterized protein n=1 Tax=Thermofilum adornatum TaxID=1365176 RepID=A0A7C1GBE9_9CREN